MFSNIRKATTHSLHNLPLHLLFDEALDVLLGRQLELVLGDKQAVVHARQGVLDEGMVLSGAEEQANGRVVADRPLVSAIPVDVGIELTEILVFELVHLELNEHMTLHFRMRW